MSGAQYPSGYYTSVPGTVNQTVYNTSGQASITSVQNPYMYTYPPQGATNYAYPTGAHVLPPSMYPPSSQLPPGPPAHHLMAYPLVGAGVSVPSSVPSGYTSATPAIFHAPKYQGTVPLPVSSQHAISHTGGVSYPIVNDIKPSIPAQPNMYPQTIIPSTVNHTGNVPSPFGDYKRLVSPPLSATTPVASNTGSQLKNSPTNGQVQVSSSLLTNTSAKLPVTTSHSTPPTDATQLASQAKAQSSQAVKSATSNPNMKAEVEMPRVSEKKVANFDISAGNKKIYNLNHF